MTFFLAAFENSCRQIARAGGVWADAFLTSLSPLTYERGDFPAYPSVECEGCGSTYSDTLVQPCYACRLVEREAEEEVAEPKSDCEGCDGAAKCHCPLIRWERQATRLLIKERFAEEPAYVAYAATPEPPAAVDDAPPVSPAAGFSLPMFKAFDLEMVALEYINKHRIIAGCACECGGWKDSGPGLARVLHNHAEHVAELVVSALVFELQGMAFDQSHPETPQ